MPIGDQAGMTEGITVSIAVEIAAIFAESTIWSGSFPKAAFSGIGTRALLREL